MSNKRIQDLPKVDQLQAGDILPVGRASASYNAYGVTGEQLTQFVEDQAQPFVQRAQIAAENAESSNQGARTYATQAYTYAQQADASRAAANSSRMQAEAAQQAIENMTVSAQEVGSDQPVAVQKTIVEGVVNLLFSLKAGPTGAEGPKGDPGNSIKKIERTSGTGAPGTTDTYTITLTDGSTSTFTVYNGANGEGAGDMVAAIYDPTGKATDIYAYVDGKIAEIPTPDVSAQIQEHNTSPDAHQDIRDAINVKPEELYVYDGSSKSLGLKALNTQIGYIMLGETNFLQVTNAAAYGNLVKFLSNNGTISGLKDPEKSGDAASKGYVDSSKVSKVADATAGNLATLTSDGGIQDSGKSIADLGKKDFVVTFSGSAGSYTCNKTFAEIQNAIMAGDNVYAVYTDAAVGSFYLPLNASVGTTPTQYSFAAVNVLFGFGRAWFAVSDANAVSGLVSYNITPSDILIQPATDYTTTRVRGMSLINATPSSVPNGYLVGVYE